MAVRSPISRSVIAMCGVAACLTGIFWAICHQSTLLLRDSVDVRGVPPSLASSVAEKIKNGGGRDSTPEWTASIRKPGDVTLLLKLHGEQETEDISQSVYAFQKLASFPEFPEFDNVLLFDRPSIIPRSAEIAVWIGQIPKANLVRATKTAFLRGEHGKIVFVVKPSGQERNP